MKKQQLKKGNEISKQIARLEIEHGQFRSDMGFGKILPDCIKISAKTNVWSQTEITDEILIAVILKEVDNRFTKKLEALQQEFKTL
ncbi:hypothetical protein N9P25_02560 [Flavobacteriaceae bacterium]|nr:hypothetical protein [Flavobacteriaceae bacterium]